MPFNFIYHLFRQLQHERRLADAIALGALCHCLGKRLAECRGAVIERPAVQGHEDRMLELREREQMFAVGVWAGSRAGPMRKPEPPRRAFDQGRRTHRNRQTPGGGTPVLVVQLETHDGLRLAIL